ncbi:MAG: CotH kinase family protein [Deltaproteobacteria bacterium]|nr:CotH kinase family protein [Deltaproteobacteria bacterium]
MRHCLFALSLWVTVSACHEADELAPSTTTDALAEDLAAPTETADGAGPGEGVTEVTTVDAADGTGDPNTSVGDGTASDDAPSDDTASDDTASDDTASDDTASDDTDLGDLGDVGPDDVGPDDTGPGDVTTPTDASDAAVGDTGDTTVAPPPLHPVVTELRALGDDRIVDGFGETSDWIEVHNPHDVPIELAGYRLSDSPTDLTRFVFPSRVLPPRGFVIVFASDRAAGPPGSDELHAPFKLSGDGETLVLATPSGLVIQTIPFPRQLEGVSYGLPFEGPTSTLVAGGAPGRYLALAPGEPAPAGWTAPDFDDSAWPEGPGGFGWVDPPTIAPGPEPAPGFLDDLGAPLADSVADWSTSGTQGERGWTQGYWNRTTDADKIYAAAELVPFPASYWTGSAWDWPSGNPPWTLVGRTSSHPNGESNGGEHWAVRRWRAPVAGTLVVAWTIAKSNDNGGGVTGHLFVDGVERDVMAIAGSNEGGVERVLTIEVAEGSLVDLAHDPTGPSGNRGDGWDGSTTTLRAWLVASEDALVGTPLPSGDHGGGILVRQRFTLDPPDDAVLALSLHADDGAAAWLDGAPIGAFGAPDLEDEPAPSDRPPAAVATPTVFTLPASALAPGDHVLALRAWDAAADDGMCLVAGALGVKVMALGDAWTWFTSPTPGAANGPAATDLGPIVAGLTDVVEARDEDPIRVTATLVATIAPISEATLHYRVGFGPEVTLPFRDDGAAPDASAGDGVHTALIPASEAGPGQMVRWRVEVLDDDGRLTEEPAFGDPLDSHRYVGTVIVDPTIVSSLPVLHWFVEDPDAAATDAGTRGAVFFRGELYDNVRFDVHGQSTRYFPKKSYDVDFNRTQRFLMSASHPRMKDVNLLTNWADKTKLRTTLAYEMLAAAGIDHHLAFPVRVQRNGAFFSVADMVEDGDDRWLERLGRDGEGALYKCYDSMTSTSQAEKKTRKDEGKEDLQALITALGASSSTLQSWIWDHVDIPGMVGFAASFVLVSNRDCCHKNYYAYRDTRGTGEWVYLPWDVDLSFGHNWTSQANYFDDTLYTQNPLWVGDGNRLMTPLFDNEDFRQMVLRRIRTLMDELVQPESTPVSLRRMELRIAQLAQQIGADADLDFAAWGAWGNGNTMDEEIARVLADFFPARRAFLFEDLSADQGVLPASQPPDFVVTLEAWDASPDDPTRAWLRITNPNTFAVDLSGARLTGDVAFRMRSGTVIPAGGALHLAADVVALRARATSPKAGERLFVQGPWTGTLSATPTLRLVDRDGRVLADR